MKVWNRFMGLGVGASVGHYNESLGYIKDEECLNQPSIRFSKRHEDP
jgi:predicted oxidoreductase (fatty acid repression mutant protein)